MIGHKIVPLVPDVIHGFAVELRIGPYPPDAPHSHRRAMYIVLTPTEERVRARMHSAGQQYLVGTAPLTPPAAAQIELEPSGSLAEQVATELVRTTAPLAAMVEASA